MPKITDWYDACIKNDIEFVQRHVNKFQKKRDTRKQLDQYYQGFTGLLYASYYNANDVALFLFPYEFDMHLNSKNEIGIDIVTSNNHKQYFIREGMSAVMVALLRGNFEIVEWMLYEISSTSVYGKLRCHQDQFNQTLLELIIQQNHNAGFQLFKQYSEYFLNVELMCISKTGYTPILLAVYFNNIKFIDFFLALTNHEIYGKLVKQYFLDINFNEYDELAYYFPPEMLVTQTQLNQTKQKINLMATAQATPEIPDFVYQQQIYEQYEEIGEEEQLEQSHHTIKESPSNTTDRRSSVVDEQSKYSQYQQNRNENSITIDTQLNIGKSQLLSPSYMAKRGSQIIDTVGDDSDDSEKRTISVGQLRSRFQNMFKEEQSEEGSQIVNLSKIDIQLVPIAQQKTSERQALQIGDYQKQQTHQQISDVNQPCEIQSEKGKKVKKEIKNDDYKYEYEYDEIVVVVKKSQMLKSKNNDKNEYEYEYYYSDVENEDQKQ